MFKLIFSLIFILFIFPSSSVLAGSSPILLSPTDGATVTSSRLEWQAPSYQLYATNPYRIQVDDDLLFATINKDTYTANTFYTPVLDFGTWYWKVKAKDSSGVWSDWSPVWSFTYVDTQPSLTPTPTETPYPTPTNTPTQTPTDIPDPTVTVLPTPTKFHKPSICRLSPQHFKVWWINLYFPLISCSTK